MMNEEERKVIIKDIIQILFEQKKDARIKDIMPVLATKATDQIMQDIAKALSERVSDKKQIEGIEKILINQKKADTIEDVLKVLNKSRDGAIYDFFLNILSCSDTITYSEKEAGLELKRATAGWDLLLPYYHIIKDLQNKSLSLDKIESIFDKEWDPFYQQIDELNFEYEKINTQPIKVSKVVKLPTIFSAPNSRPSSASSDHQNSANQDGINFNSKLKQELQKISGLPPVAGRPSSGPSK